MTDRFARIVALCTVLTTLAAAGVGYLSAQAARGSGGDKVDALQLALNSLADQGEANRAAFLQLDRFTLAQQMRREAVTARSERLLSDRDTRALTLKERRNEWQAARVQRISGEIARATGVTAITLNGRDGPVNDRWFPQRFLARHTTFAAQRLLALRDATNEQELSRAQRLTAYSVTLAMFAIAVFLFGFSLTPEGRIRGKLFAGTASLLAITGAFVTAGAGLRAPSAPPDAAADAFARGQVAIQIGDYKRAVTELDRAIELNPKLARAWHARSTAGFNAGSPQRTGYPSLTTPEALRRSNADLRQTLALGWETEDVHASLGFGIFEQGLMERDGKLLDEAVAVTRRAVTANRFNPVTTLNLGVALLAVGRYDEAYRAYEDAVPLVVYTDAQRRERRNEYAREDIVAGALTDLELLARETGDRHRDAIRRVKAQLVGSVAAGGGKPPGARYRLENVKSFADAAEMTFAFDAGTTFDPSEDQLSLQWYHRDPKLGWRALPEVSGPAGATDYDFDTGRWFNTGRYLAGSSDSACAPAGRYRVEAYLNGRLVAERETDNVQTETLQSKDARPIQMALCLPSGWHVRADKKLSGVVASWHNGVRGAAIVRLDRRGSSADDLGTLEALHFGLKRFARTFPPGLHSGFAVESPGPLADFNSPVWREYRYDGGRMLALAAYDDDGVAWVVAVHGPGDYIEGEGRNILRSITPRLV